MKNRLMIAVAVTAMFAVSACASDDTAKTMKKEEMKKEAMAAPMKKEMKAAPTMMTGDELAKAFAKGSIACKVTLADGTKAEDYYYKDISAMSGNMDRNIGADTKAGNWKIVGPAFYIRIGTGKKVLGTWMNLSNTGKKSYDAYSAAGDKVMSMKC